MRLRGATSLLALVLALRAVMATAGDIASADLRIAGSSLAVVDAEVETAIDIPTTIQTEFGGKRNDEAPFVPGLLALGELSGPGLDAPITLETTPGHAFRIPGLRIEGQYTLQNIRLTKDGRFLQPATPPAAEIRVADVLKTSVKVRQLTAEDLRVRGISLDGGNYDYYEYTFSVTLASGETVEVPYVVAIDPSTHQARPVVEQTPYSLPRDREKAPPRWTPPQVTAFEFVSEAEMPVIPQSPLDPAPRVSRPSIPAAIVIPNDIAVLHQFFGVGLMVRNGASAGSSIALDSISATIHIPSELRVAKTDPTVSFGQAVPILDADGTTILAAQAEGNAEWILEALRAGSFTIEFDLRATYRTPGQPDVPLRASPKTSILVHDPRFNITFSHPDVVREGIEYSTFSFVTNMSPATQSVRVSSGVKKCVEGFTANVCLVDGVPEFHDLTLAPGDTKIVEYVFRPAITGHAFASAGSVEGDAVTAAVRFHMGVDENGIPLSPATLLLPHYTRYLDPALVGAQLELLGLGYSLAIAPLNQTTAKFPRVIRTDVFERAADLARAGQRLFIGEPEELALFGMNLALLGNEVELREWDDLRRLVDSGRSAQAAIADRLEQVAIGSASDYDGFADRIAAANAHRASFLAAIVHAPAGVERPFAVTLRGSTTGRQTGFAADANEKWTADLPFADVTDLDPRDGGAAGALALIGRWTEDVALIVTPRTSGPITIELVHPAAAKGKLLRTTLSLTGNAGEPVAIAISPGQTQVEARNAAGGILAVATPAEIVAPPLQPVAARQDLHLDEDGHRVSVLFNRPIASEGDLKAAFGADVIWSGDGSAIRRPRPIFGAAAQADGRIVNLNFDHILSANAAYEIRVASVVDPLSRVPAALQATVQPTVDNDRPAGLLFGKVLRADNAPVDDAEIALSVYSRKSLPRPDSVQFDTTPGDGTFFFEYVPREPSLGFDGAWRLDAVDANGKATSTSAAVRTPGAVQFVNLVYLGRGSAEGYVRYEDGTKAAGVAVVVGSTMFNESRRATADANGFYRVENLPVGPLTFSATDSRGRIVYAANEVRTAGAVVVQDLVIPLGEAAGTGTVRGIVTRSDNGTPVAGARVGIFSRGYAVGETYTATDGRFEFEGVPAGFVTVLAAEWSVSRKSAAQDFDLRPDSTRELTMILEVVPEETLARVDGYVEGGDPLQPGVRRRVPGAVVQIEGFGVATADSEGKFVFDGVPSSFAGRKVKAWDPATGRAGSSVLPSPLTSPSSIVIYIPAEGGGKGTIRVRLLDAAGFPVDGFDVFVPGYPKKALDPRGDGVYALSDVAVGKSAEIWAVSRGAYGDQYVYGRATVAFDGHVAPLNLRLPGQGRVRVAVRSDIALINDVTISYMTWSDGAQSLMRASVSHSTQDASGAAGYAIFDKVPALGQFTISSAHPVHGNASASGRLAFDGDLQTYTLQLDRLASLDGVVYAIDGRTPVAGASVRLVDGRQDQGATLSGPDGSFSFKNLPAGASVQAIASVTQDGIYRTGYADAKTPAAGGAVENVGVVLRRQGTVRGRVVYAAYRVFDPNDPSKNVPDDTPDDLSDNAPVRQARLWLRELGFPSRSFGSATEPRTADDAGRFDLGNVFEGSLRASAWDPGNQELRGNWAGALLEEGDEVVALIGIGGAGVGSVEATVLDPNDANAPVLNAEVLLLRKGYQTWTPFDFASSDGAGKALFEQLPAGDYHLQAYSKAGGRSGASAAVTVAPNERTDAQILLEFIGKVSGQVIDRFKIDPNERIEVSGSHVTLDAFDYVTRATTNVDGNFLFEGVREGALELTARDPESNRRAQAKRDFTPADGELTGIVLELEPTETLHAGVYLPADDGSDSGVLAPAINVDIKQRCSTRNWVEFCDFYASLQENPITVSRMLRDGTYSLAIRELGGEQRAISFSGHFPKGSAADPVRLVLPAFGSVRVQVIQAGQPAAGARVTAAGGGKQATAYTDAAGSALLGGLRLGPVSVQVRSLDGVFSGSGSATIASQSTPATATVELGAYAGLAGYVEAESGGPSIGTRVAASFLGRSLDTLTNGEGRYQFHGIPTSASGTSVALSYLGPDEVTVGARQAAIVRNEHASTLVELPPVRLDATPPRLISFTPSDGAAEVPPDTVIQFVFSEPVQPALVTSSRFQLIPADASSPVAATFTHGPQADGTDLVTLIPPPAPPGQAFRLRSNTLYRVIVSASIADLTGHTLAAASGGSFITSDYAEPRILRVEPPTHQPLQAATTFRFVFNEPMDPAPWSPGGGGTIRLFRISAPGGSVVAEKRGRWFLDPASPDTLVFGPDDPIEGEAHYRVTIAGARDLQGNVAAEQSFEWASFDSTPPFVNLVSPAALGEPLISGVEYTLVSDIRNGSAEGTPATDVEQVEYFRLDGEIETYLTKKTAAPFSYRFVAPDAPAEGTAIAFRAIARDRSLNSSAPATIILPVRRNEPPKNVAIALDRAEAYPSNRITAGVSFADEGFVATIGITAAGTQAGGAPWELVKTKQVNRATTADPWPQSSFPFDLPPTLAGGSTVRFTARVTDVRGLSSTATATATVLVDAVAPEILTLTPVPETRFTLGGSFVIEAQARDLQSGVAEATFTVDGQTIHLTSGTAGTEPGITIFRSAPIAVSAKNVDTRMPIVATVKDWQGNAETRTVDVIYVGVNDPTVPKGAWACPVDRAAYPARVAVTIPIRIVATDDIAVTGVEFELAGSAPAPATRVGTSDVWEGSVTATMPAAGETLELTAIIRDANATHDVRLPIRLEAVAIDRVVELGDQAITASNVAEWNGKSVLVRGSAARLVAHVPLSFANLLVLEGAKFDTKPTTTVLERKLEVEVAGTLYVDCASAIDLTATGYLGGWGVDSDGSNTKNEDSRGRTVGNVATGGAETGTGASHGGLGGLGSGATTNEAYGSIGAPGELGAGGGGNASCCTAGASGGGAVAIRGDTDPEDLARIVVTGAIRADGGSGVGKAGAGSGGSILIDAKQVILGAEARISANGGNDDAQSNGSSGGGGGRIAIRALQRFDASETLAELEARGGNNGGSDASASMLDGGAGTIWLARPGATDGMLVVSSFDSLHPQTAHKTRPTPLAGTDLRFDAVTVGPRALLRIDDPIVVAGVADDRQQFSIDPTAAVLLRTDVPQVTLTTAPAAGGSVPRGGSLSAQYTASSAAGVGAVSSIWSPVTPERRDVTAAYPPTVAPAAYSLAVPFDAAVGEATLKLRVEDRAGCVAETGSVSFTIVENTPVELTRFDVTPAALSLYPGGTASVTVDVRDDVQVKTLTFVATLGAAEVKRETRTINAATAADVVFSYAIPPATPGGQNLELKVLADDAFPGRAASERSASIAILADTVAPLVAIVEPKSDHAPFEEGTGKTISISVTADDAEVGVASVIASIEGGSSIALAKNAAGAWLGILLVPAVDGTAIVTRTLTVAAVDYAANTATTSVAVQIIPLNDENAPSVSWAYPTEGGIFPAGFAVQLRIHALGNRKGDTQNGVQKVEFFAGTSEPIPGDPVAGLADYYQSRTPYTIPTETALPATITVRAEVTNFAGVTETASTLLTVIDGIVIATDMTIDDSNRAQYDGKSIFITGGKTTLVGHHEFADLAVLGAGTLTHPPADVTTVHRIDVAAGRVFVGNGGVVDASGRGYPAGSTDPGATIGGATHGGNHIGLGTARVLPQGTSFGSIYRPAEPGSGGESAKYGRAGGGVIRLDATTFVIVDGYIRANGVDGGVDTRGGGGGSVWITAPAVEGSGRIEVRGGNGYFGGGGGGAIAIEHTMSSGQHPAFLLNGGVAAYQNEAGGSGTLWMQGPSSTFGDLRVDNAGRSGEATALPSLGSGVAQTGTTGATLITPAAIPSHFEGHWVSVSDSQGSFKGIWRIRDVEANTLTVKPNGNEAIDLRVGDAWRGIYRFDSISAPGPQRVTSGDPILVGDGAFALTGPATVGRYLEVTSPIAAGDVTVTGNVALSSLGVANLTIRKGVLSNARSSESVHLEASGTLEIETDGSINVSGRGYLPSHTYPGATVPGIGSGGSHIGLGGLWDPPQGTSYGSIYRPAEAGGGGEHSSNGRSGGGAVRIVAHKVVVDGPIRANGNDGQINARGGAGGSVWITASEFEGTSSIEARGGNGHFGAGGGGAIAVEYSTKGASVPSYVVQGGSATRVGGSGTLRLHGPSSVHGDLHLDNGGRTGEPTNLPSLGSGVAESGSEGQTLVIGGTADIPSYFVGHYVELRDPTGTLKGKARIAEIDGTTLTLEGVGAETVDVRPGDSWRGAYYLDSLTLAYSTLHSEDLLRVQGAVQIDSKSKILGSNEGPPLLDAVLVGLTTGTIGPSVVGSPGAATDADLPLTAIARNERTGMEFTANVVADGSFMVAVKGDAGDAITIRARDGNLFPLESRPLTVGTLPSATPATTRLEQSSWGVDAAFRARTIARDGSTLVIGSYPADGVGSSTRVVLLDVSNPAAPIVRATLTGTGNVRDVTVADGWAFAAAGTFWAADLTSTNPAPIHAGDACGGEYAITVTGGYAFAAEGDCSGADNWIDVYDVSTPSAPRYLYRKSVGTYTPYGFTDLFTLGTDWLIGISDFRPGGVGHDLIVIDRRDPNDLKKITELEIPNFDAFRGALDGDVLWVVSRTSSEVATFDLSNPAAPALIARAFAGAQPNGITIAGGYAIVASGGSGLFAFAASDPTLMTRAGTATVAGAAWDVTALGGNLYVADDTGLSIVPVNIGPVVDTSRIHVQIGSGTATIQGLPLAVTGGLSPTVEVAGPDGSVTGSVAADGSFTLSIPADPGEALTLTIRNGDGRSSSHPLRVPFASSIEILKATPAEAANDANYRARRIAVANGRVVATTGASTSPPVALTDKALLFTLPNASSTATVTSVATTVGGLYDVEILDDWAFAVGNRIASWSLTATPPAVAFGDVDPAGVERAIAVVPGFAFTADGSSTNDGRIFSWDIANPGAPRRIGTSSVGGASNIIFHGLIAVDSGLLVAISPSKPGGVGRDVTILDRSNPAALARLGQLDVPNFDAVDGAVYGTTLYLAGLDAGIAIVDISNPSSPQHLATIDTPGIARAVAVSGPHEIVVADAGGPGLTFIDVADKTRPVILGSQPLIGNATDVRVIGSEIIVATDHHVQIVRRP